MRSLLSSNIPIEMFFCENCKTEKQLEHSQVSGSANIIYDVVVSSRSETLSVPVDVKELQYTATENDGVFDVYAVVTVDCPCCDGLRNLRYKTQAPKLLISNTPCPDCGGDMKYKLGEVVIGQDDVINMQGQLVCKDCSQLRLFKCGNLELANEGLNVPAAQIVIYNVNADLGTTLPQTHTDIANKPLTMKQEGDGNVQIGMVADGGMVNLNFHIATESKPDKNIVSVITQTHPLQPSDFFRGRDAKMEEVRRLLVGNAKLMLLNGMGGIGKTEFCRKLFHDCINEKLPEIKKVGWLVYHDSIEQSFFQQFTEIVYQTDSPADYLVQAIKYLNEQAGELLLFIDNANELSEREASLLSQLRCKVVLTSRRRSIERLQAVEIGKLNIEDCRILYRQHSEEYPYSADYNYGITYAEDDSSDEDLDAIIEMADRHTLAIELLAKTQKTAAYSTREMQKILKETGFSLSDISESITYVHTPEIGEWDKAEQIFIEQFSKVLDISGIKNEKLRVLQLFSLLSTDTITAHNVKEWFEIDDLDTVNALVSQGWVFRGRIGEQLDTAFSMHPLVTSVVRHKAMPSFETAAPLAIGLAVSLEYNDDDMFTNRLPHLGHAISLVETISGDYDEYTDLINCIAIILNQMGDYGKALALLEKAKIICESIDDTEPLITSTVYHNMASCYIRQGDLPRAKEWYQKSINIREQLPDIEDYRLATSYDSLGNVYESLGEYDKALALLNKGLELRISTLGEKHPATAISYNNIGYTYSSLGDYKKALEQYRKAFSVQEPALDTNHPDLATTHNNLGRAYDNLGNPKLAMEHFKKALVAGEAVFGVEHPDVLLTRDSIASSYVENGEYEIAEKQFAEILAVRLAVLGENHHDTATNYHNLGIVYGYLSQNEKALELLNKALEIDIRLLGDRHPNVATVQKSIADIYYKFEGMEEEAFELYKNVLDIELEAYGEKHPYIAISYNNIAIQYADQHKYEQAMEYYEKALEIQEETYGRRHIHTSSTLYNMGRGLEDTGELGKALELFLEAHSIVVETYGDDNPEIAIMGDGIAHTYDKLGDFENAEKWFKNSIRLYKKFYQDSNIQLAVTYYLYADLLERQERYHEALSAFTRCCEIETPHYESDHKVLTTTMNRITSLRNKTYEGRRASLPLH